MFAASYQNKNEKVRVIANSTEAVPAKIATTVHTLDQIPLCTEGNHHDHRNDAKVSFFSTV